jgi:hypothetical protein
MEESMAASLAAKLSTMPPSAYSDAIEVLTNLAVPHTAAATELKVSESAVRRWRNTNKSLLMTDSEPFDVEPDEDKLEQYRKANIALQKKVATLKATKEELINTVYDAALEAASKAPVTLVERTKQPAKAKPGNESALWHMTDWQLGKQTVSYNSDICRERVYRCVDKYDQLTNIMRSDHPVNDCTILFTGDMVEGCNIFPKQVWEIDSTLYEQMFNVSDLMTWTIKSALSIYDNVQVVCEWGNHGRLGNKADSYKASDNVDRMCYEISRRAVENEPGITNFQVSDMWYQHFTIGNYKAVAIHGDEIKSMGGAAATILRKVNAWSTGVLPEFNDLYLGHYHQRMNLTLANGGQVFMTGSTESDNVYAQEVVAAHGVPSQRLHFINPESGRVTFENNVWLDN